MILFSVCKFINLRVKEKSEKKCHKILTLAISRGGGFYTLLRILKKIHSENLLLLHSEKKKKAIKSNCPLDFGDNVEVTFLSPGRMLALLSY